MPALLSPNPSSTHGPAEASTSLPTPTTRTKPRGEPSWSHVALPCPQSCPLNWQLCEAVSHSSRYFQCLDRGGAQRPWREGRQTQHIAWSTGLGARPTLTAINDTIHQCGSFSKPQFSDLQNGNNDLIRIRGAKPWKVHHSNWELSLLLLLGNSLGGYSLSSQESPRVSTLLAGSAQESWQSPLPSLLLQPQSENPFVRWPQT